MKAQIFPMGDWEYKIPWRSDTPATIFRKDNKFNKHTNIIKPTVWKFNIKIPHIRGIYSYHIEYPSLQVRSHFLRDGFHFI